MSSFKRYCFTGSMQQQQQQSQRSFRLPSFASSRRSAAILLLRASHRSLALFTSGFSMACFNIPSMARLCTSSADRENTCSFSSFKSCTSTTSSSSSAAEPVPIVGDSCPVPRAGKSLRNFELYGGAVIWMEKNRSQQRTKPNESSSAILLTPNSTYGDDDNNESTLDRDTTSNGDHHTLASPKETFCRQCIGTGQWSVFALHDQYAKKPYTYKDTSTAYENNECDLAPEKSRFTSSYTQPTSQRNMHAEDCPFCIGHEYRCPPPLFQVTQPHQGPLQGTSHQGRWLVRVLPNKFAYLDRNSPFVTCSLWGAHPEVSGSGIQEVIVSHRQHNTCPGLMSVEEVVRAVQTLQLRGRLAAMDPRVRYVALFENHGLLAGGSLEHPHFQLMGLPVIPTVVIQRLQWAQKFYQDHGNKCVFCRMVEDELDELVTRQSMHRTTDQIDSRVLFTNDSCIAFVPYAPARAFQILIIPRRHSHDFLAAEDDELREVSEGIQASLKMLYYSLGDPDYNLIIRMAPTVERLNDYEASTDNGETGGARAIASEKDPLPESGATADNKGMRWGGQQIGDLGWDYWYHWYVEIAPHTTKWGGVSCFDMVVHRMLPETMAAKLRQCYDCPVAPVPTGKS